LADFPLESFCRIGNRRSITAEIRIQESESATYTAVVAKTIRLKPFVPATETDLNIMFGAIGQVESAQIVTDRDTGRSKGFAYVQMADETAAEKAIAQLNGTEIAGRTLTVNEARPMEKTDFGNRGSGGSGRQLVLSTFKRFLRPSN